MSDLIKRLNKLAANLEAGEDAGVITNTNIGQRTCDEAIDEITRLRADVERYRETLRRIAREPLGEPEATADEVLAMCADIALDALAATEPKP